MKYTIDQVRDYVEGWLNADADMNNLTMNEIKAMLHNALNCVDDESDGIERYMKRNTENDIISNMENSMGMHLGGLRDFLDRYPRNLNNHGKNITN